MERPILIACVGYILGICWGLYLEISIISIFLCVLIGIIFLRKKYFRNIIIILIVTATISNLQVLYINKKYKTRYNDGEKLQFSAILYSEIEEKEFCYSCIVKNEKNEKFILDMPKYLNIKNIEYGDFIKINGNFKEASRKRNYGGFDYSKYLKSEKIYGTIKTIGIELVEENKIGYIMRLSNFVRKSIIEKIKLIVSNKNADLFIGILLGEKKDLTEEQINNFKDSNLFHILAVSGMHINYIILGINYATRLLKTGKRKSYIFIILFLIFFMFITNFASSVVRASIMGIIMILAKLFYRKSDIINSISFSLLILLILNPYSLTNIGLQLSYGGIIGIVWFYKIINEKLVVNVKTNLAQKIIGIISITSSAQIIVFIILVLNFNTINLTFLISNVLASPISGAIVILGILGVLLVYIIPPLGSIIGLLLNILLETLSYIAKIVSNLPFSKIIVITPNLLSIGIYIGFIVLIIKKKWHRFLKYLIIFTIFVILTSCIYNVIPKKLRIYFIDVGQGDSTLIKTKYNKNILIDSGGSSNSTFDVGEKTLLPYLLDRQVIKLDYVMISHFDNDHSEGMVEVLENIKVNNILISKQNESSALFEKIINIAKEKKVNIIIVKKGDSFFIDKETHIEIMYPAEKLEYEDLNNNSIVAKLISNDFQILFTGDISSTVEEKIIKEDIKCDILKISHHGSGTSTSENFLKKVMPKIALIGVGKNNVFGHPSTEVLERLNKYKIKIYRTDLFGEIEINIKKKGNIKVQTCVKD